MTVNIPEDLDVERIVIITVDCLRWDHSKPYRDLYPNGVWYRATSQATFTPASHASLFSGLYPPQHGVYRFGQVLDRPNLLTNVGSSISGSDITETEHAEPFLSVDNVEETYVQFRWLMAEDYNKEKAIRAIRDHDLAFFHDWAVHASGPVHAKEAEWDAVPIEQTTEYQAREAYEHHVEISLGDHRQFLRMMKENGLYEGTLFVVWGDHGQAFGEPPTKNFCHSGVPTEFEARVPIGFCHPDMKETQVDRTTNVRSIDVPETLQTIMRENNIPFEPFETDGVDLTEFEGELYAYSIGGEDAAVGGQLPDAVSTADYWYINQDLEGTFRVEDGRMEKAEKPEVTAELKEYRRNVKEGATEAAERRAEPTERLKALGYMD